MTSGGYEILASGDWAADAIVVVWRPRRYARRSDTVGREMVREAWEEFRRDRPAAFPGPLARLHEWSATRDTMTLHLGATDYAELAATNLMNPHLRALHGDRHVSNGLSACAVVCLSDGVIALGKRGEHLAEAPGQWHVVGGNVSLRRGTAGHWRRPDPVATIAAEIQEELGLPAAQIHELRCTGLFCNRATHRPELAFVANLAADTCAMQEHLARAADRDEHSAWRFVSHAPPAIRELVANDVLCLTPSCLAALDLYLLNRDGLGLRQDT